MVAIEDALAGASQRRVSVDDVEVARRVAPSSAIAWAAHALLAARAGDAASAQEDVKALELVAPGSALVAFVEAEVAAVEGDARRVAERLDAATKARLALVERRAARSPGLVRFR
jgi:hypothetical protein